MSILTLIFSQSLVNASEAEYSGIIEVLPGNIAVSSTDFRLTKTENNVLVIDEGMTSSATYMPSVGVGLDISDRYMKYQFITSYSHITNGLFSADSIKFDASAMYAWRGHNRLSIGGHLTTHAFMSPKWSGDASIELSDTNAIAPGVVMLFGDEFIIKTSLDYMMGSSFDVKTPLDIVSSQSSLSLDGFVFQFGVIYNFK